MEKKKGSELKESKTLAANVEGELESLSLSVE